VRIGLVEMTQETDTFNPLPTTMADFASFGLYEGLTIKDGTATTLAVLVLCTLVLWGLATARHAASGESHGASPA